MKTQVYENCISNYLAFQASDGWLTGWLNRHNKTLRRVTTTGRDLPVNCNQIIAEFLNKAAEVFRKHHFDTKKILNMDETSIYLDCPSRYTYASKGSKRVKIDTNGAELVRISAIYSSADGEKFPLFLLVPRTNELDYQQPNNVIII